MVPQYIGGHGSTLQKNTSTCDVNYFKFLNLAIDYVRDSIIFTPFRLGSQAPSTESSVTSCVMANV